MSSGRMIFYFDSGYGSDRIDDKGDKRIPSAHGYLEFLVVQCQLHVI